MCVWGKEHLSQDVSVSEDMFASDHLRGNQDLETSGRKIFFHKVPDIWTGTQQRSSPQTQAFVLECGYTSATRATIRFSTEWGHFR